jgi:hypothetical protein
MMSIVLQLERWPSEGHETGQLSREGGADTLALPIISYVVVHFNNTGLAATILSRLTSVGMATL